MKKRTIGNATIAAAWVVLGMLGARAEMLSLTSVSNSYTDAAIWQGGIVDNVITGDILSAATTLVIGEDLSMVSLTVTPTSAYNLILATGGTRRKITLGGPLVYGPSGNNRIQFGGAAKDAATQLDFVAAAGKPLTIINQKAQSANFYGSCLRGTGISIQGQGNSGAANTAVSYVYAVDALGGNLDVEGAVLDVNTWNATGTLLDGLSTGLNNVEAIRLGYSGGFSTTVALNDSTLSVHLGAFSKYYAQAKNVIGSLHVYGPAHFTKNSASTVIGAASFTAENEKAVLITRPGFTFTDVSGITLIGGSQTLADAGPQIPVAPQLMLGKLANGMSQYYISGFGVCTYDATTGVQPVPVATMLADPAACTELDNLYATNNLTLEADAVCNALAVQDTVDLGGHTLRVKSGVVRMGVDDAPNSIYGSGLTLKNGTLAIDRPLVLAHAVNSTTSPFTSVSIDTLDNTDVRKTMLTMFGFCAKSIGAGDALLANFVGTIYLPQGGYILSNSSGQHAKIFIDTVQGALASNAHGERYNLAGLGGEFTLQLGAKFNNALFLGTPTADDSTALAGDGYKWRLVLGTDGVLAPGKWAADGLRKGAVSFTYAYTGNIYGFTNCTFLAGSTLETVLRKDGSATCVNAGDVSVMLGGNLVVATPDKVSELKGTEFVVLKSNKEISGTFETVTDGYKAVVKQMDDGTYGVVVTKKGAGGFSIHICDDKTLSVPYDWISNNLAAATLDDTTAISNALVTAGANGLVRWESWVLGLDPNSAASVVLCDAKQDAVPDMATFWARNVSPATLDDGVSVSYVLMESPDGRTGWQDVAYSSANELTVGLPAAASFYRLRTDIILQ